MAVDSIKKNGTINAYKPNAGGATLISEPVIGIVKNNIDPTHTGMIDVYVAKLGGTDPDDSSNWVKGVKYLSPFYGITGSGGAPLDGGNKQGDGEFLNNPQSYGFWASAPDIGTEVVCIFINGLQNQGYYIGCVPKPGLLQMTPAIASSSNVVPNESQSTAYGGADRLPTSEVNYSNPKIKKSPQIYNEPKPVHSYQAAILAAQGLIRDNVRGVISSSAQRETPSRVFGFSTPGGPIFEGGFTNQTISNAVKTSDDSKLKQIGRTGGHSFVMDDGTLTGQDQLIRLRSSAGHQITMSDSGQTLFIIHSNGQSWIEMNKEGAIDIYSTNSFNVRTQGDINFHADRDINMNAAKNFNIFGENINIESSKNYSQRVGVNFSQYTMGQYTVKVDGALSQQSSGQSSYASKSETFINGSKVNLNSGSASLAPAIVPPITKTSHVDTINSPTVGWMNPSPNPLVSVTNRAPAHQPWINSGKGVDVKIESTAPATPPSTAAATSANNATPPAPPVPTTPAAAASVPQVQPNSALPAATKQAVMAQFATTAQTSISDSSSAVLNTATGLNTTMAATTGSIKPGSEVLTDSLIKKDMPVRKALEGSLTGAIGGPVTPESLINDVSNASKIVDKSIDISVQTLTASDLIVEGQSPIETAGIIAAVASEGKTAINSIIEGNMSGVSSIVAGGKFAAGMADGMGSLTGLKDSLSGLADGMKNKFSQLGDSIAGLESQLKTGLQSAFSAVEKSFGTLKTGVANVLGPKSGGPQPTLQPSDTTLAGNAYDIAQAEVESASEALFVAKRNYRNEQTPETSSALQTAESNLASARQRVAQSRTQFLSSVKGGTVSVASITSPPGLSSLGAAASSVKTTLTSGLNALPGGPAAIESVINNSTLGQVTNTATKVLDIASNTPGIGAVNNVVNGTVGSIENSLGSIGGLANTAQKFKGDLIGGTKNMFTEATSIGSALDFKAGADGMMAQLNSMLSSVSSGAGAVKSPVAAVNTFDISTIAASMGQQLGSPKIPSPLTVYSGSPLPPGDAIAASAEVTDALDAITDANYKVRSAKLNLSLVQKTGNAEAIAQATADLKTEEVALKAAERAYASLTTT